MNDIRYWMTLVEREAFHGTASEFRALAEEVLGSSRAYLFHVCRIDDAAAILRSDRLEGRTTHYRSGKPLGPAIEPKQMRGVSLTRSYRFAQKHIGQYKSPYVILVLDQAKLLQAGYHIRPHSYYTATTMPDEAEEFVLGTIAPLSAFLVSVNPSDVDELRATLSNTWMTRQHKTIRVILKNKKLNKWHPFGAK